MHSSLPANVNQIGILSTQMGAYGDAQLLYWIKLVRLNLLCAMVQSVHTERILKIVDLAEYKVE